MQSKGTVKSVRGRQSTCARNVGICQMQAREKKFGCATLNLGAVALPSTWIVAMICSNKNVYV